MEKAKPRYQSPTAAEIIDRQFIIKDSRGNPVFNQDDQVLIGGLVDKDSIVKQNLGKLAYGAELSAGIEQLLHPDIGAAVEHTGKFWRNPYHRVAISMDPIMAVVYADEPRQAGSYVRRLHEGIHGTDPNGRKFNALSPEAFYWAHETFRSGVEKTAQHYSRGGLTVADKERLQLESNTWYSYYGMPMAQAPADYQANQTYRQTMIEEVLTLNPSAERAIDLVLNRRPPRPELIPRRAWWLAKTALMPATELVSLVTLGELDPAIRQRFGIPFSRAEQRALEDIRYLTRELVDSLPDSMRYSYLAYNSLHKDNNHRYESKTDFLVHKSMRLGSAVIGRTLLPAAKRIQKHIPSYNKAIAK